MHKEIARYSVFDCHLSPDWRQMAIEKSGDKWQSKNRATNGNRKPYFQRFLSTFVDSINVLDCRLSGAQLLKIS